jgi:hypothetical protein
VKTVAQTLAAAVTAFNAEVYKNLARTVHRLIISVDDDMFDRMVVDPAADPSATASIEVQLDNTRVIITRHTSHATVRAAVGSMRGKK